MISLRELILFILISIACCKPFSQDQSTFITKSNKLIQMLEDADDNTSHHTLEDTNTPQIVETIRSVDLFKAKVSKRIATSSVILHFPGMKTKLLEIAVEKFKLCEISRGSGEILHDRMDQSCLGIATAQMMSLIQAFEKNPSMHF